MIWDRARGRSGIEHRSILGASPRGPGPRDVEGSANVHLFLPGQPDLDWPGGRVRGYLRIFPVALRGSNGLYVRRESADRLESPLSGPGVQETGCGTAICTWTA